MLEALCFVVEVGDKVNEMFRLWSGMLESIGGWRVLTCNLCFLDCLVEGVCPVSYSISCPYR